jgi:hypothetical protein
MASLVFMDDCGHLLACAAPSGEWTLASWAIATTTDEITTDEIRWARPATVISLADD